MKENLKKLWQWGFPMGGLPLLPALVFFAAMAAVPVLADQGITEDGKDLAIIVREMQAQMKNMQETIEGQNLEIQQLKQQQSTVHQETVVQAPVATAMDQDSFKELLYSSTGWLKGLKQGGDMRLRMENFYFYDGNADHGAIDRQRNRFRVRLRYGIEKDLGDDFTAGFRIVTGSATDPNGTNVTLGNPGYFNYKPVFFDKAYATYKPHQLRDLGPLKDVVIGGGKVENPFLKYATPNVWDGDVTPEGAYETINLLLYDTPENKIKSQINLGQFLLNENSGPATDAELYAYQVAFTLMTDAFKAEKPISFTGAMSFYQFVNYFATVGAPAGGGASLLRTNFTQDDSPQVLDFYHATNMDLFGRKLKAFANYTKNIRNIVESGAGKGDNGYGIGLTYGLNEKPGDWELNWAYYYLEANATAAAFNDSDFGGPGYNGFTNRKGNKFGLSYRLTPSMQMNLTGYVVMPVNDQSAASFSTSEKVLRTQSDLAWKF